MSAATPKTLWAPIIKPSHGSEWIMWTCIRCTRREAKFAYLDGVEDGYVKEHLKRARFARVSVSESQGSDK